MNKLLLTSVWPHSLHFQLEPYSHDFILLLWFTSRTQLLSANLDKSQVNFMLQVHMKPDSCCLWMWNLCARHGPEGFTTWLILLDYLPQTPASIFPSRWRTPADHVARSIDTCRHVPTLTLSLTDKWRNREMVRGVERIQNWDLKIKRSPEWR